MEIDADRELLLGSVMSLLQNAFKFTQPGTEVALRAYEAADKAVLIEVEDHCGGLAPAVSEIMFRPFARGHQNKSGLGLGLTIARSNVEAAGGTLSARDVPGSGCVFTIRLDQNEGPRM